MACGGFRGIGEICKECAEWLARNEMLSTYLNGRFDDAAKFLKDNGITDEEFVVALRYLDEELRIADNDNLIPNFEQLSDAQFIDFIKSAANEGKKWKLDLQKLRKEPSSVILSDNITAVTGQTKPADYAAHHIVPGGENYEFAVKAREILNQAGIDINEAINGVFLPRGSRYVGTSGASPHSRIHTNIYYKNLHSRLEKVSTGQIREELQKIATELLNNTFPY